MTGPACTGAYIAGTYSNAPVQSSTVRYSLVRYSTVQYSMVRYITVQYSTVQGQQAQDHHSVLEAKPIAGVGHTHIQQRPANSSSWHKLLVRMADIHEMQAMS